MRAACFNLLRTALLTVLVLGGVGGTSLIDALVYHTSGEGARASIRIASSEAPRTHSASCILGAAVPVAGGVAATPAPVTTAPADVAPASRPELPPCASHRALLHNPRAPPLLSV